MDLDTDISVQSLSASCTPVASIWYDLLKWSGSKFCCQLPQTADQAIISGHQPAPWGTAFLVLSKSVAWHTTDTSWRSNVGASRATAGCDWKAAHVAASLPIHALKKLALLITQRSSRRASKKAPTPCALALRKADDASSSIPARSADLWIKETSLLYLMSYVKAWGGVAKAIKGRAPCCPKSACSLPSC